MTAKLCSLKNICCHSKICVLGYGSETRAGTRVSLPKTASFGNQGLFLHYCVEFSFFLRAPVACLRRFPLPLSSLSHTHTHNSWHRLPRKMHLCRYSQQSHTCHRLCYKTLTCCSFLTRCTIPCPCHANRHLNVQKWSKHVNTLYFDLDM